MSQLTELRARAAELGITIDQRWGENKLAGMIAAKEQELGLQQETLSALASKNPEPNPDQSAELAKQAEEEAKRLAAEAEEAEKKRLADEEAAKAAEAEQAEKQRLADEEAAKLAAESKKDAAADDSLTVKNISNNPMTIGFMFKAKPGFTVTIAGNQLTDKLRKKIAYGVKIGMLELE